MLILFSCCGIGRAAAQQQGAEQRITLSMRDTAISDILENITKRYQYAFITRTANVDTNARVSIDVVDEPLRAVLDRIFAGQEVAFEFDGRLVRISKAAVPPPSSASTIAVSGVVRDGSGNPLAGVTVMVAGTYKGVTTDNDGRYALRVDGEASVLQFLYLGYKNVEETVGKRTTIDVAMEEDLKMVDEVVVIGYGTQSRKTLTTSISKIDGDKLYGAPVSTVGDALKGKVAGLRVATNSSLSGEAPRFLIRGGSSINMGNDPIYIVDGALRDDLSGVNPNDIESMEVLKDAASAAIYGARASNGVIIVTTKKGSPSQGPQVVFDVQVGFSAPTKKWDLLCRGRCCCSSAFRCPARVRGPARWPPVRGWTAPMSPWEQGTRRTGTSSPRAIWNTAVRCPTATSGCSIRSTTARSSSSRIPISRING